MDFLRKPAVAALFVLILALIVRFAFLSQAKQAPDFDILFSDQHSYDTWAQQIVAGDWLSREQGVFFQSPLYPYFLAVNYKIAGHNLMWVRVLQVIFSGASCVLLYDATRRLLGPRAGLIAGPLIALYPSAILFDTQIDKAALDTFLLSLFVWLFTRIETGQSKADAPPRARAWLASGALLGIWALNRENAMLLIPIVAVWTWVNFRVLSKRERQIRIALFLVATLGVLCISGFRNLLVGGEFHLTTAQFGLNLWIGNGADADGVYHTVLATHADPFFERTDAILVAQNAMGRKLSAGEVSHYYVHKTIQEILADPMRWISLLARKCLLVFNRAEIADSTDLDYFVAWSSVLRCLDAVLNFPTVLALFAFGIVLTWRERRRLALLYEMFVTFALSTAAFYIFGRYRYPLVLMMIPIVAGGLAQLPAVIRQKRWKIILIGAICAAIALAISLPAAILPLRVRGIDYYNRAVSYENRGDDRAALANYRRSLRANPDAAQTHSNLGLLLAKQSDLNAALAECDAAVRLGPSNNTFYNNRATVLIRLNQLDRAEADLRKTVELDPGFLSGWFNLGLLEAKRRQFDPAIDAFNQVVKRQADFPDVHFRLGQLLQLEHRDREAVEQFQTALKFEPNALHAADALAMLLATSDDAAVRNPIEAQRIAETANQMAGGHSAALLDTLSVTYAAQGRFDDAIQLATRARALAEATGQTVLADQIDRRLAAFADHRLK